MTPSRRQVISGCAALGAAAVTTIHVPAYAADRKAIPIDEANKLDGLVKFRQALLDAVVRRDVEAVVAAVSSEIKLSFGGHSGPGDLRKFLTLSEADLSDEYKHEAAKRRETYWDALEDVLRMGGRLKTPRTFEAPYTWTVDLQDNEDPFTTFFVLGDEVAMRNRPSRHGEIITTLAHDIVQVGSGGKGTRFRQVHLQDARQGYVHEDNLRSAVDYRARFEQQEGKWKMTLFIQGD